jgi:hypothetical protein
LVKETNVTLQEVYAQFSSPDCGGDKGTQHSYIDIYAAEMEKTHGISLLEIGVWEGHSIAMWQSYFKDSQILGVDITDNNVKFDIPLLIADATKPISKIAGKQFDYIIDDGSHLVSDQMATFELLWGNLKQGGKYFIEDIFGSQELSQLEAKFTKLGLTFRIYDCRAYKQRFDDILLVVHKE